jgi:hypothetical protein
VLAIAPPCSTSSLVHLWVLLALVISILFSMFVYAGRGPGAGARWR